MLYATSSLVLVVYVSAVSRRTLSSAEWDIGADILLVCIPIWEPLYNMSSTFLSVQYYDVYFLNLHKRWVVNLLRFTYQGKSIVYAIRCRPTGQMYIGSTSASKYRFYNHFISGEESNANLQAAISKHKLHNFVAYVLEEVEMPSKVTSAKRDQLLRRVEQLHIQRYPEAQLYNSIAASVK